MENVILVVNVKVKEAVAEEVYTFMKALHKLTHEFDKGCIQYDLHRIKDKENEFCFIETWESQEALDAHMQAGHFKSFMEYVEDKVENKQVIFLAKYVEEI